MLLNCCTQYAGRFGKLGRDHRTEKCQFSFQSQRRAMPKSVQTTIQLSSLHILARLCSKSFKPGFSSTWIDSFQMYKLDLEEAEEPEIKLPTFIRSWGRQRCSRKTSTSASLTMLKPLTVWITTNWKILKEVGIADHLTCLLRNLYASQEASFTIRLGTNDWFQIGKGVPQGCIWSPCLFNLYAEYIMWNAKLLKHKLESRFPGENQ